jgi:3-oxoadipate enol-lactonase
VLESRRIPTLLGTLAVRAGGDGPAMVFWPSLLMTGAMWRAQSDHFGTDRTVVLIDPPGHGESGPLARHFTLEECALALTQVLDALGLEDCVLVGNSWGGMMGGVFAALYPQRTRAAVLMNCTASPPGLAQRIEYAALTSVVRAAGKVPAPLVGRAVKAFAGKTTERTKPNVVAEIRASVAAADARSVVWAIESVVARRTDRRPLLRDVRRPTLVIAGEEDRTFPVAETRAMAAAIPGSTFVVLPKVGHLAALEAPDTVNGAIDAFLKRSGSGIT